MLERKETQLKKLCEELYMENGRLIQTLYPWVLVRIMPKAQRVGAIYVPEKQNKVLYEGIVIASWKPWQQWMSSRKGDDGLIQWRSRLMESKVRRGDRVVFPHFEGIPCDWLDERYYRFIHEVETHPNGGIWGVLDGSPMDAGVKEALNKIFADHTCVTTSGS